MTEARPARWVAAPTPGAAPPLGAVPARLAALLARRGVASAAEAAAFLAPSPDQLHDPFLMAGMGEGVERLAAVRRNGGRVAVVGDYDADGLTATALLVGVLRACGVEAEPIIPHRLQEGYGLQPVHVERAHELGCELLVTVDCGTSAGPAIERAVGLGLGVLVTDHHLPGEALPPGTVQINPRQEGCDYPFLHLAGVGVALKVAVAFAQRCGQPAPLEPLLRIAAVGTIADLVPLVGENRVIAALGLESLGRTRSVGLRLLLERCGIRGRPRAADVGYRIAPRLNAAGRLAGAERALALLLTRDREEAARLADELELRNRERQAEELRVVTAARDRLAGSDAPLLVAWDPDWHRGVLGIAAGRLARERQRPVVLFQVLGRDAVGSARSVPGLDLHAFLARWRADTLRFGGHAQAAGLTVEAARLPQLAEAWREAAGEWPDELLVPRHEYELELAGDEIDAELLAELAQLEPFGHGNPSPLLRVGALEVVGDPRLFGNGHASFLARGASGHPVRLLGWGWAERAATLRGAIEVLGSLEEDRYRSAPVLRLVDARPA